MNDVDALRFIEAAESMLSAAESDLATLERETQSVIDDIRRACELPASLPTQVIDAARSCKADIAVLRDNASKVLAVVAKDVGKLTAAANALWSDIEQSIETGRTMEEVPSAFVEAAAADFDEVRSNIAAAQATARSLAQESIEELGEALGEFREQWLEISAELKDSVASTLEDVRAEIFEAFLERATSELNEKTAGVLDALKDVGAALTDISGTLQSSFGSVSDAMQNVEKVLGPVKPVFEAMSAVG